MRVQHCPTPDSVAPAIGVQPARASGGPPRCAARQAGTRGPRFPRMRSARALRAGAPKRRCDTHLLSEAVPTGFSLVPFGRTAERGVPRGGEGCAQVCERPWRRARGASCARGRDCLQYAGAVPLRAARALWKRMPTQRLFAHKAAVQVPRAKLL